MVLFWLRHETKEMEERTALLPSHVQLLLQSGHQVCVERSCTRCVPDSEYEAIPGCDMVAQESWETQAPSHAVILGLKELVGRETRVSVSVCLCPDTETPFPLFFWCANGRQSFPLHAPTHTHTRTHVRQSRMRGSVCVKGVRRRCCWGLLLDSVCLL